MVYGFKVQGQGVRRVRVEDIAKISITIDWVAAKEDKSNYSNNETFLYTIYP